MFNEAIKAAGKFTKPFITSIQYFDGEAESTCSTALVLGTTGYVLVAASSVEVKRVAEIHEHELKAFQAEKALIESEAGLNDKQKRKKLGKLSPQKQWVVAYEFRVGDVKLAVEQVIEHVSVDLALLKISNAADLGEASMPAFSNTVVEPGELVCKLGHAFYYLPTRTESGTLVLEPSSLPVPQLPLDGMVTRFIHSKAEGDAHVRFMETTGGALRSTSGGPVLSVDGRVVAVQSFVQPYPTGFNPRVGEGAAPQFLSLAWAVTADTVVNFLKTHAIL